MQGVPQDGSEQRIKAFRLRKIYIHLRIPRVKAEIAAIAERKKRLSDSRNAASREIVDELIYSNQHLVTLRKELEALEQERKSVLKGLKEFRVVDRAPGPA